MVPRRTTMNIGFYVNSTGATEQNGEIFNALNEALENKEVKDASVFYNDIDYIAITPKFGMFNSTDIWSFTGTLVATTSENVIRASQIVNKFKLLYLYDGQEKNLMMLIETANKAPIIVRNKKDSSEIYRLTGKKPTLLPELSIKNLLEAI
jgi:hypothetical protein